jgi:hypothetical protein
LVVVVLVAAVAEVVVAAAAVTMQRVLKELHFADVTEVQQAVTDELKKLQKEEFSTDSQKLQPHKSLYICQWCLF